MEQSPRLQMDSEPSNFNAAHSKFKRITCNITYFDVVFLVLKKFQITRTCTARHQYFIYSSSDSNILLTE